MDARVDALHVDAGMVPGAVAVAVAAYHSAAVQRIAVVTLATPTVCFMAVGEALCVHAAAVRHQARIHAVVVHAALVQGALAIVSALYRVAGDVRVALVAFFARADRFVIPHVAASVGAAVARVPALPIDAGFVLRALVVTGAGTDGGYLNWSADSIDVGGPAFGTGAGHSPHRNGVEDIASGVLLARSNHRTRIDALVLDAHQFLTAVDVNSALWFIEFRPMFTVRVRITSGKVLRAATSRQMVLNVADSILSARRVLDARIHAASTVASQVSRTVVVSGTLCSLTVHFRVAEVARTTATNRAMILPVALSVDGALVLQDARVYALTVVTGGCVVTLAVRLAVQFEATQLRISRVSRRTHTGWVMVRDVALRVGTAIARIDALTVGTGCVARAIAVRVTLGH